MTRRLDSRWRRRLTIPNLLSVLRIVAAPVLLTLAVAGRRVEVVAVFLVMTVSDWVDGRIARRFNQRSDIGPRIDSVADLLMYVTLLVAAILLDGARLASEWAWIGSPFVAYVLAGGLSVWKFGRWPHHHTRMAKISWGMMLVGATAFLLQWSTWPLRAALACATLASVQSMLITRILTEWREDVLSVAEARRIRKAGGNGVVVS